MFTQKTEFMSVRIFPNELSTPTGMLAEAEVIFQADAGPISGTKLVGFAIWEQRAGGRNVTFPARECCVVENAELRVAARDRGRQRLGRDQRRDPRGPQSANCEPT